MSGGGAMVYVDVDGSDLDEHAPALASAFEALAQRWKGLGARFVDQRSERDDDMHPDDLPDWFLGITVPRDAFRARQVDELLTFLRALAFATGREFVVGTVDGAGMAEDLVVVGAASGDDEREDLLLHVAAH